MIEEQIMPAYERTNKSNYSEIMEIFEKCKKSKTNSVEEELQEIPRIVRHITMHSTVNLSTKTITHKISIILFCRGNDVI